MGIKTSARAGTWSCDQLHPGREDGRWKEPYYNLTSMCKLIRIFKIVLKNEASRT